MKAMRRARIGWPALLFAAAALCAAGCVTVVGWSSCVADLKGFSRGDVERALRIEAWALPLAAAAGLLIGAALLAWQRGRLNMERIVCAVAAAGLAVPVLMLCGLWLALSSAVWCA